MLLLILEIAMLVLGTIGLTSGKLAFSKNLVVTGRRARIMGLILALPAPISFLTGILLRLSLSPGTSPETALAAAGRIEVGLVLLCLAGSFGYAYTIRKAVPSGMAGRGPAEPPAIPPVK